MQQHKHKWTEKEKRENAKEGLHNLHKNSVTPNREQIN